jgi:SAM-dependent methyltransferase
VAQVAEPFDEYYFAHCCGRPYGRDEHWLAFFARVADRIVSDIAPGRVLDAGCAMGLLVEALRERGVDAYGIDVSSYAIERVDERVKPFCRIGSITDPFPFGDRYDLIVSIEVLEHMPAPEAERALDNICRQTDQVIFSSTPHDYREPTHVNVHPPEYWGEQFARRGFVRDVDFDATFVTPWAVRFRRTADPLPRVVANYERRLAALIAERHDVREYSGDIQRELANALRAIDELRALQDRLTREWAAQSERMTGEVHAAHEALASTQDTVANMQRSAFWRARGAWVRLARLLGKRV